MAAVCLCQLLPLPAAMLADSAIGAVTSERRIAVGHGAGASPGSMHAVSRNRAQAAGVIPSFKLMSSKSRATSGSVMNWEQWLTMSRTPAREPWKPYCGRIRRCRGKASSARPRKW